MDSRVPQGHQSERTIGAIRWGLVGTYAVLAFQLSHDGLSEGEFAGLFVVGAIFLVVIVFAGWINNAGGEDPWQE